VHRQGKGNVLVFDPQEELERLDTAGALLVFIEQTSGAVLKKSFLYLGNASVGGDCSCLVLVGML